MATRNLVINDPVGIHARPAAMFAQAVTASGQTVTIAKEGGNAVPAGSILPIMGLGIKKGDTQLATKINNAIVDMIQDGSWENAISDNTKGTNYTPDVRYNPPTPDEGEEA